MFDLKDAPRQVGSPARPQRTWDFMETLLVGLIATGAFLLTGGLAVTLLLAAYGETKTLAPSELEAVWWQARWQASGIILSAPATIAVLWVAVRMAGRDFAEYLALNWPSRDQLVLAFGIVIIFMTIEIFVTIKVGATRPQAGSGFVIGGTSGLLLWALASCIVAPVVEEFVFRGFMFRGWSRSFLGPGGAIVLISALWAMQHIQYGWYERSWIFVSGLIFGGFRFRTKSTWLCVMAHSAMNMGVLFLGGPYV
ncbi:membrane protease YdiL (CAAX protease family) [Bradyrhizobium sp. F1.4.3]|uniref:CPBP family intramembrane glutamic endopeptidase n=1 Tax=Bradyrhizobium sp. F1.4.3 TaxID=3156356 RepID=UPI003392F89E